jgi:hypothetical protein
MSDVREPIRGERLVKEGVKASNERRKEIT